MAEMGVLQLMATLDNAGKRLAPFAGNSKTVEFDFGAVIDRAFGAIAAEPADRMLIVHPSMLDFVTGGKADG